MKNAAAWESYVTYTKDISENARKLAFAGVAVIWVLKPQAGYFDSLNLWALLLIVFYFLADILQYIIAAILWYRWVDNREEELYTEKGSYEGDYSPPKSLDVPARFLLKLKIIFLLLGFILLGLSIIQRYGLVSHAS